MYPRMAVGLRRAEGQAAASPTETRADVILMPGPPSTSGPGHHPFKVAARVRIPLGAPSTVVIC